MISLIREQYEQIMRQGAILVDDTDAGDAMSAIFLLEHSVQDGRVTSAGKPHVISQRLQFAAIDKAGSVVNAGIAPHLNLRPAKPEEVASVRYLLDESWLTSDLEKAAIRFATVELAQGHVAEARGDQRADHRAEPASVEKLLAGMHPRRVGVTFVGRHLQASRRRPASNGRTRHLGTFVFNHEAADSSVTRFRGSRQPG